MDLHSIILIVLGILLIDFYKLIKFFSNMKILWVIFFVFFDINLTRVYNIINLIIVCDTSQIINLIKFIR
jgi:hypothetical protein